MLLSTQRSLIFVYLWPPISDFLGTVCDGEGEFDELEAAGFTRDDSWDIGAIVAFFGLSNRLVTLAGTPPNPEFYLMGRVPRNET
ncbi:hypothetical protein GCM10008997_12370 [Halomonas salifodinae]